jgi:hypothetical protein
MKYLKKNGFSFIEFRTAAQMLEINRIFFPLSFHVLLLHLGQYEKKKRFKWHQPVAFLLYYKAFVYLKTKMPNSYAIKNLRALISLSRENCFKD